MKHFAWICSADVWNECDEFSSGTVEGCTAVHTSAYHVYKSAARNAGWSDPDGDHPEFVCICRHFTGAFGNRWIYIWHSDPDYSVTEHWYMCDSDYFISRSIEKCKADSISTFVF